MPMDIRNFFSKKPPSKSKSPSNNNGASSSSSSSSKKVVPKKSSTEKPKVTDRQPKRKSAQESTKRKTQTKQQQQGDDDDDDDDDFLDEPAPKKSTRSTDDNKNSNRKSKTGGKKEIVSIDDDSDTDDGFSSPRKKPAVRNPPKKLGNNTGDDDDDDDYIEKISPQAYFASQTKKMSTIRKKQAPVTSQSKKRKAWDESDSDYGDDDAYALTYEQDDEIPKKPRSRRPARTNAAPKDDSPSPTKKKAPSPKKPPPKRARKPAVEKKTVTVLDPSIERDSFDTDAVTVAEPLQGLTFVFTGVMNDLHRDNATELVKILGGRVTGSVSGRTNFLVVGEYLEDGRYHTEGKKYQTAVEKSVKIVMGEKRLYGLCHLYHERAKNVQSAGDGAVNEEETSMGASASRPVKMEPMSNPYAKKSTPMANPYARAKQEVSNPYAKATVNPYGKSDNAQGTSGASRPPSQSNDLWVDRHAPQHTRDILGNKDCVNKLANWLSGWEDKFLGPKAAGKTFSNPKGPWKAALLSGPPGIGKTTTATLVAKEAGRDLIEFNASDARSKKALQNNLGDITGSQAIHFAPAAAATKKKTKSVDAPLRCVVMDEVDGMGAGDRSGMAELIQMIKKSKVPIICICNDRQSQKMKSLIPYCMDLRFKRPIKTVMANRAVRIAKMEGLDVERNAAEAIAESCGNDVRQVLNCLQMWAQKQGSGALTYRGLKEREHSINKDEILRVSLFDAARTVMEGRRNLGGANPKAERNSLFKRSDAYFVDYSLVGLLVQQNYPKVMQGQYTKVKQQDDGIAEQEFLERMHKAADAMSDFEVVEHQIRAGDQNWSLLPTCGILAVQTGYYAGGEQGGLLPGFPEFTAWMGKNSSMGRKKRLLHELQFHMNYKISGDSQELRQDYLPVLKEKLLKLLKSNEDGASKTAIELMDGYGLSRDDLMEKFDEFQMGRGGQAFGDLDSKQKSAFTREYNSGSHKSQALVAEQGGGPSRKAGKKKRERDPADLDAIDEDEGSNDDDESDGEDEEAELKKLQESFKKKGRKKSGGNGSSSKASSGARKRSKK